ncbi:MAG TPA: phosphatase PAP2 family protein [Gemmatimonadales bacterium]|jgi:membrane-associated phospholipid phosphatase
MRNSSTRRVRRVLLILLLLPAAGLRAQSAGLGALATAADSGPLLQADSSPAVSMPPLGLTGGPTQVGLPYVGVGFGVVALSSLVDERLRNDLQAHRSAGADDVASVFRRMGQPEVYATVGLGTLAVGLVSGNDRITRAGGRITASLLAAGLVSSSFKEVVGRRRPNAGVEPGSFSPFSGRTSWPSGHATMAFALAASVSDEIHSTPVAVGLYGAAALTGWSRVNDNKHWLSDVLAGAAIGITSAKVMSGRWRVLGLTAPRFLLEPNGVGVSLQF